mmetsp:Transcript_88280/g.248587  ORF Transcript_88280/g.248587 Transcript_88280/m.248587 type:complete len:228 (-) Transcript_88280:290-973(-)
MLAPEVQNFATTLGPVAATMAGTSTNASQSASSTPSASLPSESSPPSYVDLAEEAASWGDVDGGGACDSLATEEAAEPASAPAWSIGEQGRAAASAAAAATAARAPRARSSSAFATASSERNASSSAFASLSSMVHCCLSRPAVVRQSTSSLVKARCLALQWLAAQPKTSAQRVRSSSLGVQGLDIALPLKCATSIISRGPADGTSNTRLRPSSHLATPRSATRTNL